MILEKNPDTGWYTDIFVNGKQGRLNNTHSPELCADRGCGIHDHPSDHHLKDAPMNWREDRRILERICNHGIGHPDMDSAKYLESIDQGFENIHGCDGCCTGSTFA